jgi:cobalt-zinc-cadmium efflux system membrane fusion protein
VVDQTTRTATARVVLPNPNGVWRPGLFVTATILEPVDAAVVVPRRALHRLDGDTVVFAVEDERFVPRRVTVGATGRALVAIVDGLEAGERFADEGSFLVKADLAKSAAGHHH